MISFFFWSTESMSGSGISTTSRPPLQSVDTAIQNRMHPRAHTPPKIKPDPEYTSIGKKTEAYFPTVSLSPFNTPSIPRSSPQAVQSERVSSLDSRSLETSSPTSKPINGYNMFADAHRENHLKTMSSPTAVEMTLKESWDTLTPTSREYWELKVPKRSSNTPTPINLSAPNLILGFKSFAEIYRENYASSSATPGEFESSLRRSWEQMTAETREYYSKKALSKFDAPTPNTDYFSSQSVVDTETPQGSSSPLPNDYSVSMSEDNIIMEREDHSSPIATDEDEIAEADLSIAELTKTRIQKIIDDSSPEVLEEEAKKTYDFLAVLKARLNVPEAQSHPDTKHWLHKIETLQAQVVDTPTIIGVVGNTGAGKSSVINAILDEERLVSTNCMRACTAVVTEISWNSSDDPNKKYRAEIEFIKESDWKKDLHVSLAELINDSGEVSSEHINPKADAGVAYAKVKAVYPNMTRKMIEASSVEKMLAYKDVQEVLGTTKTVEMSNPEFFYKELQQYVDSKEKSTGEKGKKARKKKGKKADKEKRIMEFWPLIKVVRIFVKADVLSTGAVIVDLPGVHDSNAARAAVAAGYTKQCTGLWVCAPINRAVDDKAARSLLGESFKRQLKYDGQFSTITFICSKTDDISVLEASDSLGLEEVMAEDSARIDEIDRKREELNAKITEMNESIEVYGIIFSEADENFDIWDDLKRDAEGGKTVYAPKVEAKSLKRKRSHSPKESLKKAKRLGYEDDSDSDDFIDDGDDNDDVDQEDEETFSDDEAKVEEEDIDRGEPLTIEVIEQRLDELKDTKKKARKEKAAIQLAIKDVRKELRESDEARREIDTRMHAECIDGRNRYSKGAIQQDFAAGIKELDNINAEEEDEENFDPEDEIRDYEAVARSLPVFCVSSRAYQQLNGRLQKDAKIPGFRHVEETEIPQLKAHCKKLTEASRSANCRRFLNSLVQIVLSISLWANDDGTGINRSDSQKVAEDQLWLERELEDLGDKLYNAVEDCIYDMEDALNENIFKKFRKIIPLAVDQAPQMVSKWGAPLNNMDPDARGLRWSTYKAICRRDGGPFSNNDGTHDWNSQLTEPIMKHLAGSWEKIFFRRLPSVLKEFTKKSNRILKTFHRDVESQSRENGTGIACLDMLAQQLGTYEATFSILTTKMMEVINILQREANREFVPVVARKLASAYTWCANERGGGLFKRMKDHMHKNINRSRHAMFTESCDEVKTKLNKMCQIIEESMNDGTDEVFMLMRRDYLQVLNGAQVTGEVMPKWERHMRSDIAHILETHERDEMEKLATKLKSEEAKEDDVMNIIEFDGVDGDNDESAEGTAVQENESNAVAENVTVVETDVNREKSGDDETDNSKKSEPIRAATKIEPFQMDLDGPINEPFSTEFPSAEDFPTDASFTKAASADALCSNTTSIEASAYSSHAN
ncbi:hypothetical protein MFRU_058g00360 [Monilinia fructicola]|nr:hypothetical protein MFRU_058g00360 [Monilinia fructicola]